MKTLWKAAAFMIAAFITGTLIQSCSSSSNAQQQGGITEEQLNTALANFKRDEVDPIAAKTAHIVTFSAGAPNPVQIAPMYDIYFDGADCTGQAYVRGFGSFADHEKLGDAAIRQGVAFRYTLPGQADEAPETYAWLERGVEAETPAIVSHLWEPGKCSLIDDSGEVAYPVQQQGDPEAYETLTGVPAGGFLDGTSISSFAAMNAGGLMGARFYDTVTSTGFYIRFDANEEPLVVRGGSE